MWGVREPLTAGPARHTRVREAAPRRREITVLVTLKLLNALHVALLAGVARPRRLACGHEASSRSDEDTQRWLPACRLAPRHGGERGLRWRQGR